MTSQFVDMTPSLNFFWSCRVSFLKFSCWSKFHVNIIPGSKFMITFLYKGLTRNPKIGNTLAWVLPNIWRLGQVRDTIFGTNVSNEMLLNAAKCQGYIFYSFRVFKRNLTEGGKVTLCAIHFVEILYFVEIFHFVEIQSAFCPYVQNKLEVFN